MKDKFEQLYSDYKAECEGIPYYFVNDPLGAERWIKNRIEMLCEQYHIAAMAQKATPALALAKEVSEMDRDWRMNTEDRVAQVNWLNEFAANLVGGPGNWPGATAEEIVEYALGDEGRDSWNIELPEWFDSHDRNHLVEAVRASL